MGIESKRSYRYEFLKSEEWASIRAEVLVRERSQCFICETDNPSNDVHHMFYRKQWRHTRSDDCHVLCRRCHELIHEQMGKDELKSMSVPDLKLAFSVLAKVLKSRFSEQIKSNRKSREGEVYEEPKPPIPKKPADYLRAALYRTQEELLTFRAAEVPGLPEQDVNSEFIGPQKPPRIPELKKEIRLLTVELSWAKEQLQKMKDRPPKKHSLGGVNPYKPAFDDFIGPRQPKRPIEFLREALEKCKWHRECLQIQVAELKSENDNLKALYNHTADWTNWTI